MQSVVSNTTGDVFECDIACRRSVAVLCILFKIRCNPMYPLNDVLPGRYMPVRVTRGIPRSHIGISMQKDKVLYGQEPPSGESTTT